MAVKKKATKELSVKYDIEDIINRGGKTTLESMPIEIEEEQIDVETRFTLRIPQSLIDRIDHDRKSRVGSVSRNQWIIEAIAKQIE
jgi:predicted HicB family RNase H-like nuclease